MPARKKTIIIETINHKNETIQVDEQMTGYQLKEHIFHNISQSLEIWKMKLCYAGTNIENDKALSSYRVVTGNEMKITQSKLDIDQIRGIIVAYEPDQITLEEKTARMPCGHLIGRDCLTQYIRSLLKNCVYKIICPYLKPNGDKCQMEWKYSLCRKIGVFTMEESMEFEMGLSQNWIKEQTFQCPKCHFDIDKGNIKSKRIQCPKCKYGDFCRVCLKPWIQNGNGICGNSDCNITEQILINDYWDHKFLLQQQGKSIEIKGPRFRMCPNCFVMIQHKEGCKRMQCGKCKKSFCWICLQIKENEWKCGSYNNYCGKVAQIQKLNKKT